MAIESHISSILSSVVLAAVLWVGSSVMEITTGIAEIKTSQLNIVENQKVFKKELTSKADKDDFIRLQTENGKIWTHVFILENKVAVLNDRIGVEPRHYTDE